VGEVLLQRVDVIAQHLLDDARPLRRDLRAGRVDRSVVPVHHQIAQTHTRGTQQRCRDERHRGRTAHVALRTADLVHLGSQQQIGERTAAAVPQRPQPSDEQCRGVQQMRQISDEQPQQPDR
jgi:hypothetical protein